MRANLQNKDSKISRLATRAFALGRTIRNTQSLMRFLLFRRLTARFAGAPGGIGLPRVLSGNAIYGHLTLRSGSEDSL